MRRALVLLAALALGAAPLTARATTAPPLTLAQQARKADVIMRATLGTPSDVTEGEVVWRVYPLTVTESVAGDPSTLPQRDGRPALYLLLGLEGVPELRAGQDTFLLLYSRRLDNPVVGFAQGLYLVENGRVTRVGAAGTPATPGAETAATTSSTATTTTPGASTATPASTAASPGTSSSGTATSSTGGTTAPGSSTSGGTATGTTPGTATSGSTTPPASATPAPTAPAASTPPSPTPPAANDPTAFPSDIAGFRDALRAARGAR